MALGKKWKVVQNMRLINLEMTIHAVPIRIEGLSDGSLDGERCIIFYFAHQNNDRAVAIKFRLVKRRSKKSRIKRIDSTCFDI